MLARCQPIQGPGADLPANQAQGRETDHRRHASDLPVAALSQRQRQPTGRNLSAKANRRLPRPEPIRLRNALGLGRQGAAILEFDPLAQLLQCTVGDHAVHLDHVGFGQFVLRIGDAVGECTIIGQKQQAFGVVVQAARRVNGGNFQVIGQRGMANTWTKLGKNLKRLVQPHQNRHESLRYAPLSCFW